LRPNFTIAALSDIFVKLGDLIEKDVLILILLEVRLSVLLLSSI